jgi:hypothetical protein
MAAMKNFCLAFALTAITNASLERGVWNLGIVITHNLSTHYVCNNCS